MNQDANPYLCIKEAIRRGDGASLRDLLSQFPELVSLAVPAFGSWLHYAAAHGTVETVRVILDFGLDVNHAENLDGVYPLKNAAYEDNYAVAEYLLDNGAIIDVSTSTRNPLFGSIVGRSPAVADLLLRRGVDSTKLYNSDTMKDMDAVAFAMMQGEREIAHMIALHNANGDEAAAQLAMERGLFIAHRNTVPVDPDEEYAKS